MADRECQSHSVLRNYRVSRLFVEDPVRLGMQIANVKQRQIWFPRVGNQIWVSTPRNRTIGVNLGVFDNILATIDINMPPLQGLILFLNVFYKHTVLTGLKKVSEYARFLPRIRCGWNADRIWMSTPQNRTIGVNLRKSYALNPSGPVGSVS